MLSVVHGFVMCNTALVTLRQRALQERAEYLAGCHMSVRSGTQHHGFQTVRGKLAWPPLSMAGSCIAEVLLDWMRTSPCT